MSEVTSQVTTQGDSFGVTGTNTGTVNVNYNYISQTKSEIEIHSQTLLKGSPYLGLDEFEAKHKDIFFGREQWTKKLTDHLKEANILLLLGASGSGKSSLIKAGLIPALDNQFGANQLLVLTFKPDVNPFKSFENCLGNNNRYTQAEAEIALSVEEDTLNKVVNTLKKDGQWLIFINQFEELFVRTPKKERNIFIKSLIRLIETNDTSVKIVLTMRADFLDELSPYPDLGKIHDRFSRMLTDMDDNELRLAIAEPAARNGVTFEKGLIEQIIADFRKQAGSLPLLQFTLDLLWKNDDIEDRVLNIKTYQDLGGVTGALQQQANKVYAQFDDKQQKVVKQIFLESISLVKGKELVSRSVDKSSFEKDEKQKEVLYQLIKDRLLVSKEEGGKAKVEVAHEALLRSWDVLEELIQENEEIITLRDRLYEDAKHWNELRQQDAQKAMDELWSGSKLTRIIELKDEGSLPNLDAVAVQFIEASKAEKEEKRQREIEAQRKLATTKKKPFKNLKNEKQNKGKLMKN